jgi:hypothetical protein
LANYNWAQVSKKAGRRKTASDLAEKVRAMSGESDSAYGARRAAYDIKKL